MRLEPHGLELIPEQLNELQSQHVLSHVIPHLEDTGLPHPLASQPLGEGGHLWRGGRKSVGLNMWGQSPPSDQLAHHWPLPCSTSIPCMEERTAFHTRR